MAELNNMQAIENILTEVDESHIKIMFSSQCIKAQEFIIDKMKKQIKHQKEVYNFIRTGNIKMEAEIKFAEEVKKNLMITHDAIKSGNIEIRKEMLIKKEEKLELIKRMELQQKKYKELWLASKSRYESIPCVQKCLQGKNRIQLIEDNINYVRSKHTGVLDEIKVKMFKLQSQDQKLIIDLAMFLINERPKIIQMIHDGMYEIQELTKEMNNLEEGQINNRSFSKLRPTVLQKNPNPEKTIQKKTRFDNNNSSPSKDENDAFAMPKLQLIDIDLEILSVKLDQIESFQQPCVTVIEENKTLGHEMIGECTSTYFNDNRETLGQDHKIKNYSDRKLIHILDDVKLEKSHTVKIISKVNQNKLHKVNYIRSDQTGGSMEIGPMSEKKNSQEKKKVSFDVSMEITPCNCIDNEGNQSTVTIEEVKTNETLTSHDISLIKNEDYNNLKDKILKEHKLDLSPQFVYAKRSILHQSNEHNVIKSKFFDSENGNIPTSGISDRVHSEIESMNNANVVERQAKRQKSNNSTDFVTDVETDKTKELHKMSVQDVTQRELPVSGFLFSHGMETIPDSLNLSASIPGFEDGDGDYPHCIDSSVLLSPKAYPPMEVEDNNSKVPSKEVPSFMSGVRKTGASFFGWTADSKPTFNRQNVKGNFNFNFSGEEKKNRGGLFAMFP